MQRALETLPGWVWRLFLSLSQCLPEPLRLVFDPGVSGGRGRHYVPVLRTGNDKKREDPRELELLDGLGMLQKQDKMPQQSDRLCEHPGPSSRTQGSQVEEGTSHESWTRALHVTFPSH